MPSAAFLTAVAVAGASTPAQAQGPALNLFGAEVNLDGMQSGIAVSGDGKVRKNIAPVISFDTGSPLADIVLDAAADNLYLGKRFQRTALSSADINLEIGNKIITSTPRIDVTDLDTKDDRLFGPTRFAGIKKGHIVAGVDMTDASLALLAQTSFKNSTNLLGEINLKPSGKIDARVQATRKFNDPRFTAYAFAGLEDGAGARLTAATKLSKDFNVAGQISLTSKYGPSLGMQANYVSGKTTIAMGLDTTRSGTGSLAVRRTF